LETDGRHLLPMIVHGIDRKTNSVHRWRILLIALILLCLLHFSENSVRAIKIHTSRMDTKKQKKDEESLRNYRNDQPLGLAWTWDNAFKLVEDGTEGRAKDDDFLRPFRTRFLRPYHDAIARVAKKVSLLIDEIKPVRDAWDGLMEGLPFFWKGYFHGFESLWDNSYDGFQEKGIGGLVFGLMEGGLNLVSMTVTGAVAGIYQGARGIESTAEAIQASKEGKIWNKILKEWFYYNLDEEAESILSNTNSPAATPSTKQHLRSGRKRVKESTFYEALNVPVDANSSEIKKAYYHQALTVHPDKSDNKAAAEEFRQLNAIYKTLVSEDTRAMYDIHGSCYVKHMSDFTDSVAQVNPYLFFTKLFATDILERYVGDLAVASMVSNILHTASPNFPGITVGTSTLWYDSEEQVLRQVEIASHLRFRIEHIIYDHDTNNLSYQEFEDLCIVEGRRLAFVLQESPYATKLLKGIALGLILETKEYLVLPFVRPMINSYCAVRDAPRRGNLMVNKLGRAVKQAVSKYKLSKKNVDLKNDTHETYEANSDNPSSDDCGMDDKMQDFDDFMEALAVPSFWKVLLEFILYDVTSTVRKATKRVLDDCGADIEMKFKKARALNILGRAFDKAFEMQVKARRKAGMHDQIDVETLQRMVKAAFFESILKDNSYQKPWLFRRKRQ
jgi:hypothetical protein